MGNRHHHHPSYKNKQYPEISQEYAEYHDYAFRQCASSFQGLHILSQDVGSPQQIYQPQYLHACQMNRRQQWSILDDPAANSVLELFEKLTSSNEDDSM